MKMEVPLSLGVSANMIFSIKGEYGYRSGSRELFLKFSDGTLSGYPELFFELACGPFSARETYRLDEFASGTFAETGTEIILHTF